MIVLLLIRWSIFSSWRTKFYKLLPVGLNSNFNRIKGNWICSMWKAFIFPTNSNTDCNKNVFLKKWISDFQVVQLRDRHPFVRIPECSNKERENKSQRQSYIVSMLRHEAGDAKSCSDEDRVRDCSGWRRWDSSGSVVFPRSRWLHDWDLQLSKPSGSST